MINQVIKFHQELEKGQSIKVITALDDYSTFINRTDIIRKCNDSLLLILRANGAKVAINTDYIISCCVITEL